MTTAERAELISSPKITVRVRQRLHEIITTQCPRPLTSEQKSLLESRVLEAELAREDKRLSPLTFRPFATLLK